MSFNLDKIRADTPAADSILHFNNAGASLMPQPVYDHLRNYLDLEQRIGGYEAAAKSSRDVEFFYTAIAKLLNASPQEIAFVENATRAWDMAVYAIPFEPGDEVLVHESEYSSNYLALLQLAQTKGINLKQVPSDKLGQIDCGELESLITPRTKAIFLTHIPSHGGLINPAEHVGLIARRHDLIYVLDACQSVGQMLVDVKAIGCDITCGTGRKFLRGPRGTGFLYVSERVLSRLEPPFVDLHAAEWSHTHAYRLRSDAKRFETYERFVGGQIALAKAVEYALDIGLETIETRVQSLARLLRERLESLDRVTLRDQGLNTSGIVTFEVQGLNAPDIVAFLRGKNINTSAVKVEHARLDLEKRGISTLVRASVHYYLTEADIEALTYAISYLPAQLSNTQG